MTCVHFVLSATAQLHGCETAQVSHIALSRSLDDMHYGNARRT